MSNLPKQSLDLAAVPRSVRSSLTYASLLAGTVMNGSSRLDPPPVECRHVTLIIPGFLGTRHVMRPLESHLRSRGLTARTVNLGLLSARSFAVARTHVQCRLRRIRDRCPFLERIDFVGHSMGGLIAADLIEHKIVDDLSVRLVTLGAPFKGTSIAYFAAPFSRSAIELTPRHRRNRSSELRIESHNFLSLSGSADALAPASACRHVRARNLTMPVDHAGLVVDSRIHKIVADFLSP